VTPITYAWALVLALVTVAIGWAAVGHQEPLWFELDEAITSWIGSHRTAWLVDAADGLEWLGSPWSLRVGLWVGLAVLVIYRRWRQLWTLAATVVGVEWITQRLSDFVARPRPEVALESIDGFAHPSMAMAGIAGLIFMTRVNAGDPTAGLNHELTAITEQPQIRGGRQAEQLDVARLGSREMLMLEPGERFMVGSYILTFHEDMPKTMMSRDVSVRLGSARPAAL